MISVFYKETPAGMERAVVEKVSSNQFKIDYFAFDGRPIGSETFTNQPLQFVETKAEDWALGYSFIKG